MTANAVLVTGANGYVGARTAGHLLATTERDVILWVHAKDEDEARAKAAPVASLLEAHPRRASLRWGELRADDPFASVDASSVRAVVHSAAVTRFNVDEETADRVNVDGATKTFRFAERCPSLENLTYVSTVYASGLRAGVVEERALDEAPPFANHYERSKFASERTLRAEFSHLPWRIARVATVIADDDGGKVVQQNAVHNTLKLFYYGLLSLVPGRQDTPVYLVTGDFVARALGDVLARSEPHGVYHLAHTRDESLTLDELVTIAFDAFQANEAFRNRRVLKPLYADAESFDVLVDGIDAFGGDVLRQALQSVSPFARQLFVHKDFKNDRLRAVTTYRAPDARALVRAMCDHLVRTRWGKA